VFDGAQGSSLSGPAGSARPHQGIDMIPPLVAGNRIELLTTGDEYFPALEAAIDAARQEVHFEVYIFEDDPTGRRIAGCLARAAGRGVAVRLMVDGFGAANLVTALREILEPAGVSIHVFRRDRRGH
jgi:cardiolipin synthase